MTDNGDNNNVYFCSLLFGEDKIIDHYFIALFTYSIKNNSQFCKLKLYMKNGNYFHCFIFKHKFTGSNELYLLIYLFIPT